jgi:hypothetical protein
VVGQDKNPSMLGWGFEGAKFLNYGAPVKTGKE